MNLLALDFSTAQRVVCVSTDAGKEAVCTTTDRTAGPLGLITAALEKAGITREEIDTIAVGLGPGSYTGIRSSIALAQGFQLGTNVQLAGISSADIIA
ncbi:MAG: tRNA (adenosine(37)-N6)-threonylcarbamoyltransferase complex dimerization subunit type 1 TsaB, partial [Limisphaerales bacterium]